MDEPIKNSIAVRLVSQAQAAAQSSIGPPDAEVGGAGEDNVLRHILPDQHLLRVPVDRIAPAREGQSRQDFNEERLAALADSLKRSGVREPIIVTPHGAEPGRGPARGSSRGSSGVIADPLPLVDPGNRRGHGDLPALA